MLHAVEATGDVVEACSTSRSTDPSGSASRLYMVESAPFDHKYMTEKTGKRAGALPVHQVPLPLRPSLTPYK